MSTKNEKCENVLFDVLGNIRTKLVLNSEMSIKGTAGFASLVCGGIFVYQICRDNPNPQVLMGCSIGTVVFGGAYAALDCRDAKQKQRTYTHEEKIAKIKHSGSQASPEKPKDNRPRYLEAFSNPPIVHSLNDLAKSNEQLYPLVGTYLYEGDIAIFFSIANKGKTIVAIQMAIDMVKGESTIFMMDIPPRKQNVWYYNFEMSEAQMKKRLTQEDGTSVEFPDNVLMIDCKGRYENVDKFLDSLALDAEHKLTGDTVIFIDTITDICPSFFSKEVSYVMNSLRTIKEHVKREKGLSLTFVIESHTTKIKDSDPLGFDNMKGGVNQSNLADSIFALGVAHGEKKTLRYMKVLKARNDEIPETVDVLEFSKSCYVRPHFVGISYEEDVLPPRKKPTGKGLPLDNSEDSSSDAPIWDGVLSLEKTIEMKEYYQEGVTGRGAKPTARKFGLKHPNYVKRELDKLEKHLAATSESDVEE